MGCGVSYLDELKAMESMLKENRNYGIAFRRERQRVIEKDLAMKGKAMFILSSLVAMDPTVRKESDAMIHHYHCYYCGGGGWGPDVDHEDDCIWIQARDLLKGAE
jgi:hypothetical protein